MAASSIDSLTRAACVGQGAGFRKEPALASTVLSLTPPQKIRDGVDPTMTCADGKGEANDHATTRSSREPVEQEMTNASGRTIRLAVMAMG